MIFVFSYINGSRTRESEISKSTTPAMRSSDVGCTTRSYENFLGIATGAFFKVATTETRILISFTTQQLRWIASDSTTSPPSPSSPSSCSTPSSPRSGGVGGCRLARRWRSRSSATSLSSKSRSTARSRASPRATVRSSPSARARAPPSSSPPRRSPGSASPPSLTPRSPTPALPFRTGGLLRLQGAHHRQLWSTLARRTLRRHRAPPLRAPC